QINTSQVRLYFTICNKILKITIVLPVKLDFSKLVKIVRNIESREQTFDLLQRRSEIFQPDIQKRIIIIIEIIGTEASSKSDLIVQIYLYLLTIYPIELTIIFTG